MFAFGMDAYIIAGIIPEISSFFQINEAQSAQMVTAFTLCYALSAPILATVLSNVPTKKTLILSMVLFIAANLATIFSINLTMLLISRALAGIGAGIFSPLAAASAASLVPEEKKGRALGLILGGMSAGTVVGVPTGLALSSYIGWQGIFGLVILIALLGLIGVIAGVHEVNAPPPPSLKERVTLLASKQVSATIAVTFLTAVASLGLYSYLAPIISSITDTTQMTPYLWTWGLGGMIGSFTVGHLIDWSKKPRVLLVVILAVMSLSLCAIPFGLLLASPLMFLPFLLWGATGWSSLAPQQHTLLELQPQQGAAVVALNSSCNYLGGSAGTILGAVWLSNSLPIKSMPFAAAIVGICAVIIQLFIVHAHNTKNRVSKEVAVQISFKAGKGVPN
ncbi:MFS transporter [Endozoicomonas sp. Mp262]|uniref:MFS transporter n=1 Tax=Endozoicomonas sp. Mp262 TaxID=2919499 RepID=UPI0021D91068